MRKITTHRTDLGDLNDQVEVAALDKPDHDKGGGACHVYEATVGTIRFGRITFQHGPVKEHGINGISDESLLAILIDRMEHFQAGQFACDDNANVLDDLHSAMKGYHERTRKRTAAGVEGTNAQAEDDPPKKTKKKGKKRKGKSPVVIAEAVKGGKVIGVG